MNNHQEYAKLCALYTSGSLSEEQIRSLTHHLEHCADCRRAINEFREIESMGLAAMSPEFARSALAEGRKAMKEGRARQLLARIENEIDSGKLTTEGDLAAVRFPSNGIAAGPCDQLPKRGRFFSRRRSDVGVSTNDVRRFSRALWLCAAALLLSTVAGIYGYHAGGKRVADFSSGKLNQRQARIYSLEANITELSRTRNDLNAKLLQSEKVISALTTKVRLDADQVASLEEQTRVLAERAQGAQTEKLTWESERETLKRELDSAQRSLTLLQKNVDSYSQQRLSDLSRAANLGEQIDQLTATIRNQDQTIRKQQDLLAYSRDIRNLIGARDLYVAEVTDVGRDAETEKPFGRVFYTKGKSLIFYAYDLDTEPGAQSNSVFAAWGRRGSDFGNSIPLGILYRDELTQRRWVLKLDSPKTLAMIDAVFVTVEPRIDRKRPFGKPLLFAYLRVQPNHP
jgi:DNA repair exonuclease SbcCD ATPase subunit